MRGWLVVVTGASGSVYGLRLVEQLLTAGYAVTLFLTRSGREVMAREAGVAVPETPRDAAEAILRFMELDAGLPLQVVASEGLLDAVSSRPVLAEGMVVCPASMGFCGSMAAGLASDAPSRVAAAMLEERRPVVLVPRESPLTLVHLRNLTTLAEAGALIVPADPSFERRPSGADDLVDFVVGTVLDQIGVQHDLYAR